MSTTVNHWGVLLGFAVPTIPSREPVALSKPAGHQDNPLRPQVMAEFSENLMTLLAEKGMNMADAARDMTNFGYTVRHYHFSAWKHHKALPSRKMFANLCNWLDCEPTDLLREEWVGKLREYER